MDFLALVKRLATETGTELEEKITSVAVPPATSYGETTEHRTRLVNWVQQAWIDIQGDQEHWYFTIDEAYIPLVTGQVSYVVRDIVNGQHEGEEIYDEIVPYTAPVDNKYIWVVNAVDSDAVRQPSYRISPEFFFGDRDRYNDHSVGVPYRWSIDYKDCLVTDSAPPNDDYQFRFQYKMNPQVLTENTDEPRRLPERFHMLIVYHAMVFYAGFDEAGNQYKRAEKLRRDMMNKLRLRYMPDYSMVGVRS